jgi:hypothetical protein
MTQRLAKCLVTLVVFAVLPVTQLFDSALSAFPCIYKPYPMTQCSGTDVACLRGCPAPPTPHVRQLRTGVDLRYACQLSGLLGT